MGTKEGHEILTPAQMYEADRQAGHSLRLMENAGKAVVREILRRYRKCQVAVLCGPGNNGGDGFVVARLLKAARWPVRVHLFGERAALRGDAAKMAARWKGAIQGPEGFESCGLVVDAIYGAGLSRDFPADLAQRINALLAPVVAVDVPSGLDGLNARPRGACVRADVTVTFCRKKPAHVLYPGRALCGEVVCADIAIPDDIISKLNISLRENVPPSLPEVAVDAHKYSRGGALIFSGEGLHGSAARLAAMAAARSGAGAVTLCGSPETLRIHAAHLNSIMLKTMMEIDEGKYRAACIGPGHGVNDATKRQLLSLLRLTMPVLVDADALTSFAAGPGEMFDAIAARPGVSAVLTPHEGEFRRLFSELKGDFANKVEVARAAARLSGAIILYKGPDTVIAHPDGRAVVNVNGTSKLATAGSGDVLAGIITGLMAQGMEPFSAACAGAWLHADAAQRSPRRAPMAEDLIENLP